MKIIWIEGLERGVAEFCQAFTYKGGKVVLRISADYRYVAYVNGRFASNGQYADTPLNKCVDEVDITSLVHEGENELFVVAIHTGEGFSVAQVMDAGVAFELIENDVCIAQSDENTKGRVGTEYSIGDRITPQLGYGWKYNFTAKENEWAACQIVNASFRFVERPLKKLILSEPLPVEVVAQGVFKYRDMTEAHTAAGEMQNAWLSTLRFFEMTGKERTQNSKKLPLTFVAPTAEKAADGVFVIVDMGKETSGYITFSLKVKKPCRALLGWGEHLADLRVRTEREGRNFASELTLQAGENVLDEWLHRIGGRYLCLFVEDSSFALSQLSVHECLYPFKKIEKDFGDRLLNEIYRVGRRTLELCAHEHYEDCPWREQALYGMDSRNQMMFGYSVFEEYDFPRASMRLFGNNVRKDGLIEICAPARAYMTIPSFSVYWILAICDNADVDFNAEFIAEVLPTAENVLEAFKKRSSRDGVSLFVEPPYWNFHEWCDGLDGGNFNRTEEIEKEQDGILTAIIAMAAKRLAALQERCGYTEKAKATAKYAEEMRLSLEGFYDEKRGL